jgi:hypothetical protein
MTTQDFDHSMDMQDFNTQDDLLLLAEQERDFAEMESARESALKQQGAMTALTELKTFLTYCALDERCHQEFFGLKWAVESINRRLGEFAVNP